MSRYARYPMRADHLRRVCSFSTFIARVLCPNTVRVSPRIALRDKDTEQQLSTSTPGCAWQSPFSAQLLVPTFRCYLLGSYLGLCFPAAKIQDVYPLLADFSSDTSQDNINFPVYDDILRWFEYHHANWVNAPSADPIFYYLRKT